ncbi:anion permease [Clostridium niameyense]|uniref:Probable membrane transporter protein n=1 Tax=Clostridium niameyense TaxID=1622073 RepID=A0A6M0R734_9CLOT|nr:TSUP family transporter [Clostridium niameyense]NEZ46046.1 anion permease [Clostridium niameyense]
MVKVVLGLLILLTAYFTVLFLKDYLKCQREGRLEKTSFISLGAVGFVTNFFDTLGIGSFAPSTALLKNFKLSADRTLPGTLNAACTIPVAVEALLFINGIQVEPLTLFSLLIAATIGAVVGAGIVSKLDEKKVQFGMGIALIIVALVMFAGQLNLMPAGGEARGLHGYKLIVGIIGNFIFGALMTLGIGLYAPCMALVYALGMSPKVAFPIMMGSCAFLMPAASVKFIKEGAYDRKASMAITIFGLIGVFIAYYLVKSLPLDILKWLIIVVILYTSIMMFRSAFKNKKA